MAEMRLFEPPPDAAPNLTSYDLILVNSSAGKDSQALLDHVVELCEQANVPRGRIVVAHADLGRIEWDGTLELAREHAEAYGLRFESEKRPQGDILEHVEQRGMWPDAARRYCTSDHKRGQVRKILTRLVTELREAGAAEPVRVLNCMGMRAQESPARAKRAVLRSDPSASNGRRSVDEWLLIKDWSADEVWDRVRASGLRHHPAYDLGMPRLSCSFCVLASRSALVRAAQLRPELAEDYRRVEVKTGHRFRQDLSMEEIIAEARMASEPAPVAGWVA